MNRCLFKILLYAPVPLMGLITIVLVSLNTIDYRLGKSVLPLLYDITIKPYLLADDADEKRFTYDGDVRITLKSVEAKVRQITLHKDYIDIKNTWLYDDEGHLLQSLNKRSLQYDPKTDKLTVTLSKELDVNAEYQLRFNYTGQIYEDTVGFFRVNFTDSAGHIKWLGVTHMHRINARRVFPCFDEPRFKAKFRLHISRPKHYNVISNTRLIRSVPDGATRCLDHFEVTPKMPTYLVAFIISEYKSRGNDEYAIVSRPEYFDYTEFSYNVGLRAIEAFSQLFKHPYKELGNPILQHVTSPKFPHNGMENWGLIIYSERVLVHQQSRVSWSNRELTTRVVVHETSHMWFGDSVTFYWWSYCWLNEGFARYYEYFAAHELYPQFQLDQQFVINQVHYILTLDASDSTTQPLTSPESSVSTPLEIGKKFGAITYSKGAAVLRMISNAMGVEYFNLALHQYLKQHHLGSVVPTDLFVFFKKHWPSTEHFDLDQFFYDWTEQVGYPMVIANASADLKTITFSQQRFLYNRIDGSDVTLKYTIPITVAVNSDDFKNLTPSFILKRSIKSMDVHFVEALDWIVLNKFQSNYHRVFYDETLLSLLQAAFMKPEHSGIPPQNRAQIIDDLFNFAHADLLDYAVVIQFLEYLCEEVDYLPWYATFAGLQRVVKRLTVEQLADFSVYLTNITQKVYAKLGFRRANETVLDVYNRNRLVSWLCKYGHIECNREANMAASDFLSGSHRVPTDFRPTLYCSASRAGAYSLLYNLYQNEIIESEREKLWLGISCTKYYKAHYETAILNNGTSIKRKITGIAQLYVENPENIMSIFTFLTEDVQRLAVALDSWHNVADVFRGIAEYLTTEEQQKLLEIFIAEKGQLFGSAVVILRKCVKSVKSNLEMAEQRFGRMIVYLKNRNEISEPAITKWLRVLSKHDGKSEL